MAAAVNGKTQAVLPKTKTIHVPHLGGIDAAYQTPNNAPLNPAQPTLVLVNSFTTSSELYQAQYADKQLTDSMNLLAIELLGHGQTRTKKENWTYWDTAIMNLQVLDALGVKGKVFVLGTSQGGWITARMALLAPEKIAGIIPLGTSMDYESPQTRELGCWNAPDDLQPVIDGYTSTSPTPDFAPGDQFSDFLIDIGFGKDCPQDARQFWRDTIAQNYAGDEGRRRIRMASINLRDRDGLHNRLSDIRCPVLWLHGTADVVYSVKNAEREIKMMVNSPDAKLQVVEGGQHFLSFSHPKEVGKALIAFVGKYGKDAMAHADAKSSL